MKSGQSTPKMAQIEAYIYIFNIQVLKTCHCITNTFIIRLKVTENIENLAILPPKLQKNRGTLQTLRGSLEVKYMSD